MGRQGKTGPWVHTALTERLVVLWEANTISASEIATKLNIEFSNLNPGLTRQSIIGKAHRMRLTARAARGNGGRMRTATNYRPRVSKAQKAVDSGAAVLVRKINRDAPPEPTAGDEITDLVDVGMTEFSKPLIEAEDADCRWPVGDKEGVLHVCGRTKSDHRYCAVHWRMSRQPARPKSPQADAYMPQRARPGRFTSSY